MIPQSRGFNYGISKGEHLFVSVKTINFVSRKAIIRCFSSYENQYIRLWRNAFSD